MTPRLQDQNCKFFTSLFSHNSHKRLEHIENQTKNRKMTRKPQNLTEYKERERENFRFSHINGKYPRSTIFNNFKLLSVCSIQIVIYRFLNKSLVENSSKDQKAFVIIKLNPWIRTPPCLLKAFSQWRVKLLGVN